MFLIPRVSDLKEEEPIFMGLPVFMGLVTDARSQLTNMIKSSFWSVSFSVFMSKLCRQDLVTLQKGQARLGLKHSSFDL